MQRILPLLLAACSALHILAAPLTVATYNLEFYVDAPTLGNPAKPAESRQLIRQALKRLNADVVALQEIGRREALNELVQTLAVEGLSYPHVEYIQAADTNLHLAFLSRLPIVARRSHTNENLLYQGKRHRVLRGFGEIEVALGHERVTLLSAHLKSRRQMAEADQEGIREEEAGVLRERIDEIFLRQPKGKLIVLGDLNDEMSSRTFRTVLGKGKTRLFDPRPAEPNGDSLPNPNPRFEPRRILWTHHYAKEETYSRIDYILLSPNLRDFFDPSGSYVLAFPNWGAASDHRPVSVRLNLPD